MERGRAETQYDSLWGAKASDNRIAQDLRLPTSINGFLAPEHETAYQVMFRIAEITSKLRSNDFAIPANRTRSPSPPPVYDTRGRRTNTREQRYKRKLEDERHRLVEIALRMIPDFVAPPDYRRPTRFQDKYFIPTEDYPEINFVGLLLGPRGNTLKKLQQDSGCKISIRGRGSVRSGKAAGDLPKGALNMNDPLHCIITADTEDKIPLGIKACESIVVKAVTSPEGQNDLKRGQLRELAVLNGTLREDNYVQTFGRKRIGISTGPEVAKRFKEEGTVSNESSGSPNPSVVPSSNGRWSSVESDLSMNLSRLASPTPPGMTPHSTTAENTLPGMLPPGMVGGLSQGPSIISAPGVTGAPGLAAPGFQPPGLPAPGPPGISAPGIGIPGLTPTNFPPGTDTKGRQYTSAEEKK